ncbi:MAG: oxidoreductase [Rhodocyclaceae bacterium]|nr:MAG: oxidoreductase [Rhodocyclaceae bacterium]
MKNDLIKVVVAAKTVEALDIFSYDLRSENGENLPPFEAGAHVDVHLANGLVRQYSLCNAPGETNHYMIAVLRDPNSRGGSVSMHDDVKAGDTLSISKPRNHFPLVMDAKETLLLAGGIGITPILCMAEALSATKKNFSLHYGARSTERMAYRERILSSSFANQTNFYFDDGDASQKFDLPTLLGKPQINKHLYVCGPQGFIGAVKATALDQGWAAENVHYEYFGATIVPSDKESTFQVKIASSGQVIVVPSDQTIVAALASAGIQVPISCEQGVCGTCLTRVIDGVPDHRDQYLTPQEHSTNNQMLLCCSRSQSPLLVLDL